MHVELQPRPIKIKGYVKDKKTKKLKRNRLGLVDRFNNNNNNNNNQRSVVYQESLKQTPPCFSPTQHVA